MTEKYKYDFFARLLKWFQRASNLHILCTIGQPQVRKSANFVPNGAIVERYYYGASLLLGLLLSRKGLVFLGCNRKLLSFSPDSQWMRSGQSGLSGPAALMCVRRSNVTGQGIASPRRAQEERVSIYQDPTWRWKIVRPGSLVVRPDTIKDLFFSRFLSPVIVRDQLP